MPFVANYHAIHQEEGSDFLTHRTTALAEGGYGGGGGGGVFCDSDYNFIFPPCMVMVIYKVRVGRSVGWQKAEGTGTGLSTPRILTGAPMPPPRFQRCRRDLQLPPRHTMVVILVF